MIFVDLGPQLFYRAVSLEFLRVAQSPKGSRLMAGRFNRVDTAALYVAADAGTAYAEFQQDVAAPRPTAIVAFEVRAERIIDLRVAGPFVGPWADWKEDWHDAKIGVAPTCPSWECGQLALDEGATGIIFPSMQNPGGTNLVLFVEDATFGNLDYRPLDAAGEVAKYAASPATVAAAKAVP